MRTNPCAPRRAILLTTAVLMLGASGLGLWSPGDASAEPKINELRPLDRDLHIGYGGDVAVSGDLVVVCAPEQRAIFVYGRNDGQWILRQRIPSPVEGRDGFGSSVAVDGNRILVGAPEDAASDGRVYVYDFDRSRAVWKIIQELTVGRPGDGGSFGSDVALDGDTFAISATAEDDGAGAVYIWRLTLPNFWAVQARVIASDAEAGAHFGTCIDVEDFTLVASAPDAASARGTAYVFDNSGRNWLSRGTLSPPTDDPDQRFGAALDYQGDTIIVGAPGALAAHVFTRGDSGIALTGTLLPAGPAPAETFGIGVAVHGDIAAVSDSVIAGGTGEITVYARSGDGFVARDTIVPPDDLQHIEMGTFLAIDDDLIATSSPASATPVARVFAIDVRERTDGYLAPVQASYVAAPGKKAAPGLSVSGLLDLGPAPVNLARAGTLRIGNLSLPFPGLTQSKSGKPFVLDDGTLSMSVRVASAGSSKATFALAYTGDLVGAGIDPDGVLDVAIVTPNLDVSCSVTLVGGTYRAGKKAPPLRAPLLVLDSAKAKAKGAGKGSFKLRGRFSGHGEGGIGSEVTIRFGDEFEETILVSLFKQKKAKWTYKNGKAEGVSSVVIDTAKGTVSVAAKRLDLTSFGDGPVPLSVGIETHGISREANVAAVAKSKPTSSSLKY